MQYNHNMAIYNHKRNTLYKDSSMQTKHISNLQLISKKMLACILITLYIFV